MKNTLITVVALVALVACAQKSTEEKGGAAAPEATKTAPAAAKAAPAPKAKPAAPAAAAPKPAPPPAAAAAKAASPANVGSAPGQPPTKAGLPAPADVAAAPADAVKTASGLASKVLKAGTGTKKPGPTDTVKVHYTGWTTDGKMFDSSVARGAPISFPLNRVIKGWTEGVGLMVVGEKRRLWIPVEMAYGKNPARPGAPQGDLVFDVELLAIEPGPRPLSPQETQAQFLAFSAAVKTASAAVCACKDLPCAEAIMKSMSKVKVPATRPSPEQINEITPIMRRMEECGQKLKAASAPQKAPLPIGSTPPPAK